jgi:hypothetical protein
MSMAVTREKLRRLAEQGVDVCVHMCPNCHIQFDRFHDVISQTAGEDYPFVHLHVQQLLALALGADPDKGRAPSDHGRDRLPRAVAGRWRRAPTPGVILAGSPDVQRLGVMR